MQWNRQPFHLGKTQKAQCYLLVRTVVVPCIIPLKKTGAEAPAEVTSMKSSSSI